MKRTFTQPASQNQKSMVTKNHGIGKFHPNQLLLLIFFGMGLIPFSNQTLAQTCCPEFSISDAVEICPIEGACMGDDPVVQSDIRLIACKNSAHTYTVYPNDPGFSYTWTVSGGTLSDTTSNPNTIIWGSSSTGYIKVVISNLAFGGTCIDSLTSQVCLLDGPEADFYPEQDTVCENTSVQFVNSSLGGSHYTWDFGDGTTSTDPNPQHAYAAAGTYTVTLTAQDMGQGQYVFSQEPPVEEFVPCGCIDTITKTVVVLPGSGPEIKTDCCFGTVCPGDTSSFCSPPGCATYNWIVSGGSIVSGAGTNCISVAWDAAYTAPTSVSLVTPGCSIYQCGDTTKLDVPVLYPALPILGPANLCQGASGSFTLPTLPGTYYTWTVGGGGYVFNMKDRNTPTVNITFLDAAVYTVKCDYHNPLAGCSGTSIFTVDVKPVFEFIFGEEMVCEGDIKNYNTNGSATWTVSPAGPVITPSGSSATVHWATPGTYFLSATPTVPSSWCNASAVKIVEVVPLPVLNTIAGSDSACPDKNYIYSISSDNDDNAFVWTITGGTGTIVSEMGANSDSVVVKWNGSGPWQLSVYQENKIANSVVCTSLTETLDIFPFAPPLISGALTVCVDAIESYTSGLSGSVEDIEWVISPPNRGTIQSGQGTGAVTIKWHGTPTTATLSIISCAGSDAVGINIVNPPPIPVISINGPTEYCLPALPNNLSLSVPSGYASYQWYHNGLISGANTNTYNIPNGTFSGAGVYVFEVIVSNGLCEVTSNILVLIGNCDPGTPPPLPFDCEIDFVMNPDPACENQPVTFTALPPVSGFTYAWDFGDGSTSFESPTEHAYVSSGTYTVTLTATLGTICVADTFHTITINPVPNCAITANDTIFCPWSYETLTACTTAASYQWYKDNVAISGATNYTYDAVAPGEYHVVASNAAGCSGPSNKIYMYLHQLPKADIEGPGLACALPGGTTGFLLQTPDDPDYGFSWSSMPAGATFTPAGSNSPYVSLTAPATLPAIFEFVVVVTDLTTGCENSDTLCVPIYEQPQVWLPSLNICEGNPVTLTPTLIPNDPSRYTYQWNNGSTNPTITAVTPGFYSLIVKDKVSGCTAYAQAGLIFPKPDVSLFPTGCADLCPPDSLELYLPLPLNSPQWPYHDYGSAYPSITWYDNGNYAAPIGSGETLNFVAGNTGSHEITALVQNHYGCIDTAGVFCLNDDVCCKIIVDYLRTMDATCPESADGSLHIQINTGSVGGPFTITRIFPPPTQTWPITPGVPFTLNNLSPGTYAFQINSADGSCSETFDLTIGYLQEDCCFAAIDSAFVHITSPVTYSSDMVWDNKYYIADGVMVTVDGAMLDITNVDVVFGECAGIEFVNGGYLRANNSVFRPCDIDKSWKGLRFDAAGKFDNIVNESTFKNAEAALYFKNETDAVISNNLFSNCNNGVRVEYNNAFNHPISGNRFVTDDFFPDFACDSAYSFVNNNTTYNILSVSAKFSKQVSHNEFINAKGYELPSTFGIYQLTGGGVFTENTFTDVGLSFYILGQTSYTSIKNNEIELNGRISGNFTAIFVVSNQGPVIEILNNEISNNFDQFSVFTAMYIARTNNLSIAGNVIDGFNYGIFNSASANYQITNNTITNANNAGIWTFETQNNVGFITCNTVTMRNMTNSFGMVGYYLNPPTEISSNCFTDCNVSMSFYGLGGSGTNYTLPLIRNNFLYNYNTAGINVSNYSGDIGTAADPGLNTLWSNNNSAVDIQSNSTIYVADNFGMFNISFPAVQITSNNPYHSTASCGRQIFNMPSQGNLNINYDCDNFDALLSPMAGSGGNYSLQPNYQNTLKSLEAPYAGAATILASVAEADESLLEELLSLEKLTPDEQALLQYRYYYSKADYDMAANYLEIYNPTELNDQHFKTMASVDLKVQQNGWEGLSQAEIANLEQLASTDADFKNYAISMLNNISGFRDHYYEIPQMPDVTMLPGIKRVEDTYLNIFPNPAGRSAEIQLVSGESEHSTLNIYNISGELCAGYNVNFVAGSVELDISGLDEGVYFVVLSNPESGIVRKGKLVKISHE